MEWDGVDGWRLQPGDAGRVQGNGAAQQLRALPAIADLDHDGFPEIVFASRDGNLYAWHSNGTNLTGFPIALGGPANSSVAIGMLDGPADTTPEIVAIAGAGDDSLYVFEPNGARRPGFPVPLKVSGGYGKRAFPGAGRHERRRLPRHRRRRHRRPALRYSIATACCSRRSPTCAAAGSPTRRPSRARWWPTSTATDVPTS